MGWDEPWPSDRRRGAHRRGEASGQPTGGAANPSCGTRHLVGWHVALSRLQLFVQVVRGARAARGMQVRGGRISRCETTLHACCAVLCCGSLICNWDAFGWSSCGVGVHYGRVRCAVSWHSCTTSTSTKLCRQGTLTSYRAIVSHQNREQRAVRASRLREACADIRLRCREG